ncbi:MAG TPA: post-COAP-1 domain-containing protein [Fimbriimonadaceae bacterium]|nr:post-COAP-1 domain-containing protein [Fimbriimonadaceae bacterium]
MAVVVAASLQVAQTVAQPYRYVVTEMPVSDGFTGTGAYALNRDGLVVGYSYSGNGLTVGKAFLWKPVTTNSPNGSHFALDQLGAGSFSVAGGISNNSRIAGYAEDESGQRYLTTWDVNSGDAQAVVSIVSTAGFTVGINDVGQIAYNSASSPWVYLNGTSSPLQCSWGAITAINQSGDVAGFGNTALNGTYQGIVWRSGSYNVPNNVGAAFGGVYLEPGAIYAINSLRLATGYVLEPNGVPRAYVWDFDSGSPSFVFPPEVYSTGYGINEQGDVVGSYRNSLGQFGKPFLIEGGAFYDLQSEIDPTSGWYLTEAFDINEFGQICGFGYLNGRPRGYLLTPANQPPTATNDFYVMNQATTLSVPAPGIQANDTDPDEDALTASLMSGPVHATNFTLNPDGSFTYTPLPYFFGTDTFTYKVNDGSEDSNVATVSITVNQPGAGGFISGGGKFFDDGNKCTFGFVAKVLANGVQGNLEFQDHDSGLNVKSTNLNWVYAPNSVEGYFSGACTVNGQSGYSFFVSVHDRGEPGRDDDFTIWVLNALGIPVHMAEGQLTNGGNVQIHR